jgi:preprotein translocase subunit SecF
MLSNIRAIFSNSKIDFMKIHKITIYSSFIFMALSILLVFVKGLNLGIDFTGGLLVEIRISNDRILDKINHNSKENSSKQDQINIESLNEISHLRKIIAKITNDASVQTIDSNNFLIKIGGLNLAKSSNDLDRSISGNDLAIQNDTSNQAKLDQQQIVKNIQDALSQEYNNHIEYRKIDFVGPQIGSSLIKKGFFALFFSFISILIYIWFRFDWQFGIGGIFALIHDTILTLGFFAITQLEFNLTSIAAILTIIGYSINDSVVIYDRIRENITKNPKMKLDDLINSSTNSTLSRTVLTAGATIVSLLALIFFGGDVLRSFSVATFFGIIIGTYSSIYISAPILLYFNPVKQVK